MTTEEEDFLDRHMDDIAEAMKPVDVPYHISIAEILAGHRIAQAFQRARGAAICSRLTRRHALLAGRGE